jgi:hypothetical protein
VYGAGQTTEYWMLIMQIADISIAEQSPCRIQSGYKARTSPKRAVGILSPSFQTRYDCGLHNKRAIQPTRRENSTDSLFTMSLTLPYKDGSVSQPCLLGIDCQLSDSVFLIKCSGSTARFWCRYLLWLLRCLFFFLTRFLSCRRMQL